MEMLAAAIKAAHKAALMECIGYAFVATNPTRIASNRRS